MQYAASALEAALEGDMDAVPQELRPFVADYLVGEDDTDEAEQGAVPEDEVDDDERMEEEEEGLEAVGEGEGGEEQVQVSG